jgi:hypothetical protein
MGVLLDAARSGNKRLMLEALRDEVAETIEVSGSGRDMAALSKRLMEICAELDAMPDPEGEVDPVDDLAKMIAEYDEYDDPRFGDEDGDGD